MGAARWLVSYILGLGKITLLAQIVKFPLEVGLYTDRQRYVSQRRGLEAFPVQGASPGEGWRQSPVSYISLPLPYPLPPPPLFFFVLAAFLWKARTYSSLFSGRGRRLIHGYLVGEEDIMSAAIDVLLRDLGLSDRGVIIVEGMLVR